MSNRRPYVAESSIAPGTGVVQGTAENQVKAPGSGGSGDYIGVYPFDANASKDVGDSVGIELDGVVKVLAGGSVTAGKKAVLKSDTSGSFVNVPTAPGRYATCGTFLQSGSAGEYVDMIVERGSVTITA